MKQVTRLSLKRMKRKGEKIVMITAYDYLFARIFDEVGVDIILVGDSLGNVIQGRDSTIPVTMDEMIYHTKMVTRGFMKEAGAHGIKLEGGAEMAPTVERLTQAGIPVMGHVGLTPQSVHQLGGYRVQGKKEKEALKLIEDVKALQKAGAFSVVLECTPVEISKRITDAVKIATIGIGAGVHCDGQVLVMHDLLGLTLGHTASFVKSFVNLGAETRKGVEAYIREVREEVYPDEAHSFTT